MTYRLLSRICLKEPVNDPDDRSVMPMSTVIASHQWRIECWWGDGVIGDPQIFRNANVSPTGAPMLEADGVTEMSPLWTWWNGIPRDMVKSYRFEDAKKIPTQTNAEPQAKPASPRSGRAA